MKMMRMIMLFLPLMIVILREWLSNDEGHSRKKIRTNNLTDRSHYPTISIHFIQIVGGSGSFPILRHIPM